MRESGFTQLLGRAIAIVLLLVMLFACLGLLVRAIDWAFSG